MRWRLKQDADEDVSLNPALILCPFQFFLPRDNCVPQAGVYPPAHGLTLKSLSRHTIKTLFCVFIFKVF